MKKIHKINKHDEVTKQQAAMKILVLRQVVTAMYRLHPLKNSALLQNLSYCKEMAKYTLTI